MSSKIILKLSLALLLNIAIINFAYSDCSSDGLALTNTSDGTRTASCSSDISMGNRTTSIQLSNYPTILSGSVSLGNSINSINTTNILLGNSAYGIYGNSHPAIVGGSGSIGSTSNTITTGNISAGLISRGISFYNYGGIFGGTGSIGNTTTTISTGNISVGNGSLSTGGSDDSSYGIIFLNFSGVISGAGSLGNTTNTISTGNISTGNYSYGVQFYNYPAAFSGSVGNINNSVSTNNITTGNNSYGIQVWNYPAIVDAGSFGTITNTFNVNGNISTGDNSSGISLINYPAINRRDGYLGVSGSFGAITNTFNINGNISTGANSYGIDLFNDIGSNDITNTVNMSGNITTTGNYAYGIYLRNSGSTSSTNIVNMTGNITTSGNNAYGITLANAGSTFSSNTVNMTGDISTGNTFGIVLDNTGSTSSTNTVNMTGDITTGAYAESIYLKNANSTSSNNIVNMTGNISTASDGILLYNSSYASNSSNTVNMIGNISATGAGAKSIELTSGIDMNNTNTINMTGRISATGLNSYAIFASNSSSTSSNTVQLNKGSSVVGVIYGGDPGVIYGIGDYTANNFLKLNLGAGASYSFATTGFTVQDLNGRPMVTGSAYAAGVGNITTASQSLYERTSQITQSIDDRVRTYDAKQNTSQDFWVNTYYSDSNRGGQGLSGDNLSFNQYRSGMTAGFNVKNSYTPTELIMNYEHGQLNIDEGNQSISSNSVMAGILFPDIKKLFTGTLSAKALVGYSDFSGDRKVLTNDVALNGSRNVTASYQSTHLTLGSAWTKTLYQTDKVLLDTLVGVDLNTQHINSYSESDLFKWNGRTINQLQERVTLGMEMKPLVKPLTLYGRLGIERRDLLSGENQNYAINNTAVSYNDSNQRNTYATLNAGAYYPLTPTVKAYAQVRYYDSTKNIDALSGSIGISGQF